MRTKIKEWRMHGRENAKKKAREDTISHFLKKVIYCQGNRKDSVKMCRLRLGHCGLNNDFLYNWET